MAGRDVIRRELFIPGALEHIRRVRTSSIDLTSPIHGALHGMSKEALVSLLNLGFLTGRSEGIDYDLGYQDHDIFVFPIGKTLKVPRRTNKESVLNTIRDQCAKYASDISFHHRIFSRAGIPISYQDAVAEYYRISENFEPESINVVRAAVGMHKLPVKDLRSITEEANQARGFLVSFGANSFSDFRVFDGDGAINFEFNWLKDRVIRTLTGLPYRYITSIEPLGPEEAEFLKSL